MIVSKKSLCALMAGFFVLAMVGCGSDNEATDEELLNQELLRPGGTGVLPVGPGGAYGEEDLGGGLPDRDVMAGMQDVSVAALTPVYFAYDSSSVAGSETYKLQMVAQHLQSNPRDQVVLEGHADERGSREYNLALGERRALAVRAYLIQLGVSAGRLQTRSYGEESPAAYGHDESAWAQNRRVEFQVLR